MHHNLTKGIAVNVSADMWVIIIALVAYGTGAIVGESKKVQHVVFGAGAVMGIAALAVYTGLTG